MGATLIVNRRKALPAIRVSLSAPRADVCLRPSFRRLYDDMAPEASRRSCNILLCSYMHMFSRLADFAFYSSIEPQIASRIWLGLSWALLFAPTLATFVQPFLAFLTRTMFTIGPNSARP